MPFQMEDLIWRSVLKHSWNNGKKTKFSLTTIEKENSITKSSLVSLELFDLEEENLVELPIVFSVKSLPVSAEMSQSKMILTGGPTYMEFKCLN